MIIPKGEKDLVRKIMGGKVKNPSLKRLRTMERPLQKYQGVVVDGKKFTRFSQIKVTPARKKSMSEKVGGGIKLAIL